MQRNFTTAILVTVLVSFALVAGCNSRSEHPAKAPGDHSAHASHGSMSSVQSVQVVLSSVPEPISVGESAQLTIMLHDASGKMLKEFEPTHTKLAHLIIVREGLDEFTHLHPAVDQSGNMLATHTFPKGGSYHVFLDYKLSGKQAETAQTKLVVAGDSPSAPTLKPDVPGTIKGDGVQAEVAMRSSTDKAQIVALKVQDEVGQPVSDLQPYLGAMGHLVVLSADGGQYVHAHPLTDTAPDGIVEFEVHFPGAGTYKGWGQFQRGDKIFTIPIVMLVTDAAAHH